MDDQRAAYVALAMVPGIGPARLRNLLEACQTPLGAHAAPFAFLCAIPGITSAAATALKQASPEAGQRILDQAARLGASVLIPSDDDYPELLRKIPDPPTVLFALGDLSLLRRPAVAMVGSRNNSPYGAEVCRRFAAEMARAGAVVVSGMARGLDAVAHQAALDVGGGTIGVLGNGLGVIYPAANRGLYERVTSHGLLLTEHPPGERPNVSTFPRRNRLISGLSRLIVVIEAAEGSGALITVDTALNQGRDVMAVPGPITSPTSIGTNRLIRDGAAPVLEPQDLFDHYPELTPIPVSVGGSQSAVQPLPDTLTNSERTVATLLTEQPTSLDDVASRSAVPIGELLGILTTLEISGVVKQLPGRRFQRV